MDTDGFVHGKLHDIVVEAVGVIEDAVTHGVRVHVDPLELESVVHD